MIDIGTQTAALETKLNAAATLDAYTIERSQRINFDPAKCPWIGVYPGSVNSRPKTISSGGNSRWDNEAEIQVVAQTSSYDADGKTASDQLEDVIKLILDAVNADLTLGVTGTRVVAVNREYRYVVFDDDQSGSLFMPQCVLKIHMEVRSS